MMPMPAKPNILLIEDQKMIAKALGRTLQTHYDVDIVHNKQQMLGKISNKKFDLLLLDMKMDDGNTGVHYMQHLKELNIPVLIVATAITDVELFLCHQMGAKGAISKSLDEDALIAAAEILLKGQTLYGTASLSRLEEFKQQLPKLTPRYLTILAHFLASEHLTDPDIAMMEDLELGTVKNYVSYVVKSFAATSRRELTDRLRAMGFTPETLAMVYSYLRPPTSPASATSAPSA